MKTLTSLIFTFSIISISLTQIFAQEVNVIGKVVMLNKYPVNHASIKLKSLSDTVFSKTDGTFQFTCKTDDQCVITANGFYPEKFKIKNFVEPLVVNLKLKGGVKGIEIATGYNHVNKDQMTYAIEHFEAIQNNYASYSSILELIKGRIVGAYISSNSIFIRGSDNHSDTPVLLVVDGCPVEMNVFQNIPPSQVKTIDVLKGAAAARYGARGFSGVVVVQTIK